MQRVEQTDYQISFVDGLESIRFQKLGLTSGVCMRYGHSDIIDPANAKRLFISEGANTQDLASWLVALSPDNDESYATNFHTDDTATTRIGAITVPDERELEPNIDDFIEPMDRELDRLDDIAGAIADIVNLDDDSVNTNVEETIQQLMASTARITSTVGAISSAISLSSDLQALQEIATKLPISTVLPANEHPIVLLVTFTVS